MTASSREFHLGDILSVTTRWLVSPNGPDGVADILSFMTGKPLPAYQHACAARACAPALRAQHPALAAVAVPCDPGPGFDWAGWVKEQAAACGEYLPVTPLPLCSIGPADSPGPPERGGRPRPGLGPVRAIARLAWGVDLHAAPGGQLHASLADAELIDPFTGRPDLDAVVSTEQHGPDLNGDLLVITRTLISASGSGSGRPGEVPAAAITPPTEQEAAAVHAALDYLGYTGPRQVRLLLTADHT